MRDLGLSRLDAPKRPVVGAPAPRPRDPPLERAGSVVIRIEPGATARQAMGLNPMSEHRSHQVVAAAIAETARSAAEGRIPPVGARARRMSARQG